ncbi:CD99 molecule isoform X1 [Colossoma macropomum]|uniref:CD99 molecule isoform X1 n=1 Tax=Colossoma macropomum TaxID=42526 RepID=UPI001864DF02|nr:CD99 molecule isoform X1 [Colossoma macropomum]
MTSYLWILVLASLAGTWAQDLDLSDALDLDPVAPTKPAQKPPKAGGDELDLSDALGPDTPNEPKKPAGNPSKTGGDFDILDALDPKKPAGDPKKPVAPPKDGGGGFSDSDLSDVAGNDYKPDAGRGGHGGRAADSSYDSSGGDGGAQEGVQGGQMAGILSAVGVAILGAASSYFAYQKKKLCFKIQGGTDPESGVNHAGTQSEPQVLSNLLKSS